MVDVLRVPDDDAVWEAEQVTEVVVVMEEDAEGAVEVVAEVDEVLVEEIEIGVSARPVSGQTGRSRARHLLRKVKLRP